MLRNIVSRVITMASLTLVAASPTFFAGDAMAQNSRDRYADVVPIASVLSHDHYLGEDSGATHYWHGENRDAKWFPKGYNRAVTDDTQGTVHPDLKTHSERMEVGIFQIKDKFYKMYGYGLTSASIIDAPDGLIVLDPMESADKMRIAMSDFRKFTGSTKEIKGIVYSHWHTDHYAGVRGLDKIADDVVIIAHETFMSNLSNNSMGGLGPAIGFRVDYSLGTLLDFAEDGRVNGGLGPDFVINELTMIPPNTFVEGTWGTLDIEIAGKKLHVAHIPSEASDEIIVYLAEERILWGAEVIQGESFPNLHTIRGTRYRDPQNWFPGIDKLRGYNADILTLSHGRPVIGAEHVEDTLTAYRDAIQFTYDQSIKAINDGATQEDLIRDIELPAHLKTHPWLGDFYGSIRHAAKQVFVGELGWFDGDPTTLNATHSTDASIRYVEMVGGKKKMMEFAKDAANKGDYQWAAELATHVIRLDLDDMAPRMFKAEMLRELGYAETNTNWRNWYITSAQELEGTIDYSRKIDLSAPDLLDSFGTGQLVNAMRFSLNAERTINDHYTIAFNFGDEAHALEVRRGVAQFHEDYTGNPAATVNISKNLFVGILLGTIGFTEKAAEGLITIDGNAQIAPQFFASLDKPAENPRITLR